MKNNINRAFDQPIQKSNFIDHPMQKWMDWSVKIFNRSSAYASIVHLKKEAEEMQWEIKSMQSQEKLIDEYADGILCILSAAGHSGFTFDDVMIACNNKANVNYNRKWKFNHIDNTYKHIK